MLLPFFYPPFFASGNCLPDPLSDNWNGQAAVADGVEISFLGDRYGRKTAAPFIQKSEPIVLYSTSVSLARNSRNRAAQDSNERRNTVQTTSELTRRNSVVILDQYGADPAGLAAVIKSSDRLPFVNGLPLWIQTKAK